MQEEKNENQPLLEMQDRRNPEDRNEAINRSHDDSDEKQADRTWVQRTIGPMIKGSIRGSVFTLCSVTVGSGVLALPYTFTQVGFMLGFIMLGIATIASFWSQYLIVRGAENCNVRDYASMVEIAGGTKLKTFLNGLILCYKFGSCTSFQIIIGDLTIFILEHMQLTTPEVAHDVQTRIIINVVATVFLIVPMSLIKNMHGFRYISLIVVFSLIYTLIVMLV